ATRLPHRACPECGFYRDEKVMKKTKAEKKIEKELEKA
ncbi:MAG: 50S ribosomal protein L32, partial [Candidatus Hydrothermia bacterium]